MVFLCFSFVPLKTKRRAQTSSHFPRPNVDTTCADGTIGIQMADSCCVTECGVCGGVGCSTRVPGLSALDCCSTEIADAGVLCSDSGVAPCVVDTAGECSENAAGDIKLCKGGN